MTTPSFSIHSADERKLISDPSNAVLFAYLDTLGTGAGTYNMAGAAANYFIKPPVGLVYLIDTVRIVITTGAHTTAVGFGGIAALVNGCKFEVRSGLSAPLAVVRDLTGGKPIKTNSNLGAIGSMRACNFTADSILTVRVRNERSPLRLTGDYGDALYFQTQDNLAGINTMYVSVQGTIFKN